ncbi:RcnB family protein [Candidatus Pantoea floridensis]|uniref:Regulator RcnB of Ni and Co efflux n=1 Tax=Candidatus Pantoea floridensis TaxID=1938870 RepID=A0A286BRW9_9GAMM|nr:RcnB family protein [Pantoea floridensis]PIF23444.1 Ni/Co efflux regulator RcnB [Enterobacteriaceae bacterium JKS000233]SOD36897.1 regulator RcnB of Ni and Co efflux [Pantoea floridensis]
MRRTHVTLLSAGIFLGALSLTPAALAEGEQTDNVPPPPQVQQPAPDAQTQAPTADAPASNEPAESSGDVAPIRPPQSGDASAPNNYDLTTIIIDYKEYKVGDVVPDEYRKKQYTIVEWQPRHLPAPQPGTHWAYINANYILITDDSGKIVMGKSGEIFFRG